MALNPKYSNVAVNAEADALGPLLNSGFLEIYAATQPTTADTAISGQANLATLTFAATAFPGAVAGVLTANAIGADSAANATGAAAWFRCFKTGHTPGTGDEPTLRVFDGSVGTSAADLVLNSTAIQVNAAVSVSSLTITLQKG